MARKPTSPYARKGKKPHRYSEAYHRLRAAYHEHGGIDNDDYRAAEAAFARKHDLPSREEMLAMNSGGGDWE